MGLFTQYPAGDGGSFLTPEGKYARRRPGLSRAESSRARFAQLSKDSKGAMLLSSFCSCRARFIGARPKGLDPDLCCSFFLTQPRLNSSHGEDRSVQQDGQVHEKIAVLDVVEIVFNILMNEERPVSA